MQTHQGLTLDRYLKEKGPLGPDQAARIAIQVAQQMGPAAGSLLIHPGRILVTREGTVRLLPPPAVTTPPSARSSRSTRGRFRRRTWCSSAR